MDNARLSPAEIEFGAFMRALWGKRRAIAAGTMAAVIAAAITALLLPERYEVIARLAIADFHFEESMTGEEGRETFAARVSTRQTYAMMVYSQNIAQRIVEEYNIEEELDLTPEELLEELAVQIVPNTALLVLTLELPHQQLAYDVCLAFARAAEELSREVNEADRKRVEAVLAERLAAADADLDHIGAAITEFGGAAAIRALEAELDLLFERRRLIEQQRIEVAMRGAALGDSAAPGARTAFDFLDEQRRQIDIDIVETRQRMAEGAPVLRRLESEFETALAMRSEIAQRLEGSEITVAGQIAELILVDPPVFPEEPSSPGALTVIAVGFFLGLTLSTLIAGMAAGLEVTAA